MRNSYLKDAPVEKRKKEVWARLVVGLVLNIALFYLSLPHIGKESSIERDVRESFIDGSLAIATWVFVLPVFWRGAAWQAPIAFVLIFFLPGLAILQAAFTIIKCW